MQLFFHLLVTGEIAASQSVSEWTKQVIVRRSLIVTIWRMLQHLGVQLQQCVDGYYHATV